MRATAGTASTGALSNPSNVFTLTCTGTGGSDDRSVTVTVTPTSTTPAPTVTINANPSSVTSGGSSNLTWSSTDATSCSASGAWSGSRPTSGSASTGALSAANNTFTLSCSGAGGSAAASASVSVTGSSSGATFGLDFGGNDSTTGTVRFRFTNPLAQYPATYMWRVLPRRQSGYYTAFFWGNDGTFFWDGGNPNSYYGAHPYPQPAPNGSDHKWEISVNGRDYLSPEWVEYGRWHTQVLRVWSDGAGKHHEYFWDWPNTSRVIRTTEDVSYANVRPTNAALTFGDAPWAPSTEIMDGVMRGIQVYSTLLSVADVGAEIASPKSTAAGASNIWYLNLNPTPTDISDKSGAGNNPQWVGSERARLWSGQ